MFIAYSGISAALSVSRPVHPGELRGGRGSLDCALRLERWSLFILGYRPLLFQIDANFHRRAWTFVVSGAEGKKTIRLLVVGG